MTSLTYGEVSMAEVVRIICDKAQYEDHEYKVVVGTDSQNFDKTKVVVVIALHDVGHGGIFFYDVFHVKRISKLGEKLIFETQTSLEYAHSFVTELDKYCKETGFEYSTHFNFSIHVDAGINGPSKQTISTIVGWIKSCGYDVEIKPDSFAACSIANKISK